MTDLIVLQPTRGIVFTKAQDALEDELAACGIYPQVIRTDDMPVPECRNFLVEAALKLDWWKYALLIDDDVILPEGGLKALLEAIKTHDIALIDYPHHSDPFDKEKPRFGVAVYDGWKEGDPVEGKRLAWGGLGCVLVRRKFLEKLPKPAFQNSAYQFERLPDGSLKFDQRSKDAARPDSAGEDVYFFFNAQNQKARIAVLHGFTAGHARVSKWVYRLAGGKYRQQHLIEVNAKIDRPEV